MKKALILFLLCLLFPLIAQAQDLNPEGEPNFGSLSLDATFPVDPYIDPLISGGTVNAATTDLGAQCVGFIAPEPDMNLFWSGTAERLRFFFLSAGDTTLVIRDPNGDYRCDDDGGINSGGQIEYAEPLEGTYSIWVGSFNPGEFYSGYLMFTQSELSIEELLETIPNGGLISDGSASPEDDSGSAGGTQSGGTQGNAGTGDAGAITADAAPVFGEFEVVPAFTPDPHEVAVMAGGSIDTYPLNLGDQCRGSVTAAPTYRINAVSDLLALTVYAVSNGDSTLIVRLPDGSYRCNDDYSGRNPGLTIDDPSAGTYDIWVGTYTPGVTEDATLYISEIPELSEGLFGAEE